MNEEIHLFMIGRRPYLLHRYSVEDLSRDTGIPIANLYDYIRSRNMQTFRQFINFYRILYCKDFLERTPPGKITAFDLSVICGFPNVNTFVASFKKIAHIPTGEYIRRLRKCKI